MDAAERRIGTGKPGFQALKLKCPATVIRSLRGQFLRESSRLGVFLFVVILQVTKGIQLEIVFVDSILDAAEELASYALANRAFFGPHFPFGAVVGFALSKRLGVGPEVAAAPFGAPARGSAHGIRDKVGPPQRRPRTEART